MAIEIVDEGPDPSVVKEVICKRCGVKLRYLPLDVEHGTSHSYDGSSDGYSYIKCPKCDNTIMVK